ncbi:MAG: DNA-directed RNA polymerase subunit Rpo4/RpoF [Candidatus Methanohalarchaeum thermophilum]|uniref:DNA-directed RNA polymerase subunit Rpo4 n=1 Tax=Methanohalarchaeum thermophilum TaxID=1903181 RepID=A0A1Q6DXV8_METT1|nr:MAG: DNA-directed RNA polymerase subunit Rpo4/RpoF [Candidatus Methanohalarchaeum thermophilum]
MSNIIVKEVKEDEPIPTTLAGKILKEEGQRREEELDEELGYAHRRSIDHTEKFTKITNKKAEELFEELIEHPKVTDELAVKMIDLLPEEKKEIRALYSKERFVLDEEGIEELLEIIKNYR